MTTKEILDYDKLKPNSWQAILIVTFVPMKSGIKIFLLTILSCCYINTVFEFSDTEKNSNFENESHCYIHQDNNNLTIPTAKTVQHFDIAFHLQHSLTISANSINKDNNSFRNNYFSTPLRKRFLLFSSLLI